MARLPQPGSDNGTWGDILNEFLLQSLKSDGKLQDNAVTSNTIAPNSVTSSSLASNAVTTAIIQDGSITEELLDASLKTKLNASQTGLDGKLDKIATANQVYVTDGTGAQSTRNFSINPAASSIAQRTTGGALTVGTPTADGHATTRLYVDTAVATKVSGPDSVSDNAVARFDGTTGKLLQSSGVSITDTGGLIAQSYVQSPIIGNVNSSEFISANQAGTTSVTTRMQMLGTGANDTSFINGRFIDSALGAGNIFVKSRGASIGQNVIVQTSDVLGNIGFDGADGNGYLEAARIRARVDNNVTTGSVPGILEFMTTAEGTSAASVAMTIRSDNRVYFAGGTIGPASNQQHTLPAVSSDTFTLNNATQTLTNKTLTSNRANGFQDINGATVLSFNPASSAVNYLSLTNAATTNRPSIAATGTDSNIDISISPKGSGSLVIAMSGVGQTTASISAGNGSEANVNLNLTSKGTGTVKANAIDVATISGAQTLTNKTISGANNALSNIAQGSVTNLLNDLNNKADIIVGGSGDVLTATIIQTHPESNYYNHIPYLFNDIVYNNARGGSVVLQRNGVTEAWDATNAFRPDVTYSNISFTASDTITIEVTLCKSFTYATAWGICMSEAFRARDVVIELWDSVAATWLTATTRVDDTVGIAMIRHGGGGNGGANPITKVRYTLTDFSSYTGINIRVTNIFAVNYNSNLLSESFMPRGGGDLYAPIRHPRYATAGRPSASSSGAGAEIYDTTLNKPVWSDGTNWRDASGTIV